MVRSRTGRDRQLTRGRAIVARAEIDRDLRRPWESPSLDDPILFCMACSTPLHGDPDEDPTGEAGMPICGNCARERAWFDIEMGLTEHVLDDDMDLDQ